MSERTTKRDVLERLSERAGFRTHWDGCEEDDRHLDCAVHREITALRKQLEEANRERDRETELRRASERHNRSLIATLDRKPYRDEYDAVEAERDRYRAVLEEIANEFGCERAEESGVNCDRFAPNDPCRGCVAARALAYPEKGE